MKKRNVIAGLTALALSTMCTGAVFAEDNNTDYIKGDVTGDGYVGTEDVFYTMLDCFNLIIPDNAVLPPMVQYNDKAGEFNSDGVHTLEDAWEVMHGVTGKSEWANGYHKITSSDKSEVTYYYDGEYVVASVSIKKLTDTAIVYDKTKLEYVEYDVTHNKYYEKALGAININEEIGFIDVVAIDIDGMNLPEHVRFGTFDIKFKVKDDSKEVTLGSCTGAGYIQDNLSEGESFTDAAKKYEEALYTEETVNMEVISSGNNQQGGTGIKIMPESLTDARQILKQALKIENPMADKNLITDVNKDGQVTLEDAQLALKMALNIPVDEEL